MASLVLKLQQFNQDFETKVCVKGQHCQMLDQVLSLFEVTPDFDLNLIKSGQTLFDVTSGVLKDLEPTFEAWTLDVV